MKNPGNTAGSGIIRVNNDSVRAESGLCFETRHRHHNGGRRDVRVSLRPLHLSESPPRPPELNGAVLVGISGQALLAL